MKHHTCALLFVIQASGVGLSAAADSPPSGVPQVLNFSRYDIAAIGSQRLLAPIKRDKGADQTLKVVYDGIARNAINFRYIRASGVQGAIFQSSYIAEKSKKFNSDDSFRVWASDAATNNILVGAYHFFRPQSANGVPNAVEIARQADGFKQEVVRICKDNPKSFKGRKVLLAFDATTVSEASPEDTVKGIYLFANAVHEKTGIWPCFYPENKLRKTFGNGVASLSNEERRNLAKCPMWSSRYSKEGPLIEKQRLFGLWTQWALWQYSAGEHWYPDGGVAAQIKDKNGQVDDEKFPTPWKTEQSPAEFAKHRVISDTKEFPSFLYHPAHYPIGVPGSAIPLEGNYFNGSEAELIKFWEDHGWIALP